MPMETLTQSQLKEWVDYDPLTGVFTCIKRFGKSPIRVGDRLGSLISSGYIQIYVNGVGHLAHRLAWLFQYGEFPKYDIDHKDQDKTNNAIANLRQATRRQNIHNQGTKSTNSSGFKGVYYCKQKQRYQARIRHNGKRIHLGFFSTPEEASKAYKLAAKEYHGDFYNGPSS